MTRPTQRAALRSIAASAGSGPRSKGKAEAIKAQLMAERLVNETRAREDRRAMLEVMVAGQSVTGDVWHVAVSGVMREARVVRGLEQAGFVVFCPMERVMLGVGLRRREVERALFPRYVFFATRPGADVSAVSGLDGLAGVISSAEGVWRVASSVAIMALAKAEAAGLFDATDKVARRALRQSIAKGDSVMITSGPLKGWPAEVVAVESDNRLKCLMNMLGKATTVRVPFDRVEKVA